MSGGWGAARHRRAMMAVVKADGYGHGLVPAARAAREAGAEWLGVATSRRRCSCARAATPGRVLCWLAVPGEDYAGAIAADVDVCAYSVAELAEIAPASPRAGRPARLQLKVDTGLSRGGAATENWAASGRRTPAPARRRATGRSPGSGRTSRAATSPTTRPTTPRSRPSWTRSTSPSGAGLRPEVRHLANSAAAILRPSSRFDLVRAGSRRTAWTRRRA